MPPLSSLISFTNLIQISNPKQTKTMPDKEPAEQTAKTTASKARAKVRALKTPVAVPGGTLAKGGTATIDLKTAEHKEKSGELEIIQVL